MMPGSSEAFMGYWCEIFIRPLKVLVVGVDIGLRGFRT
jgi:hypothetical protein